MSLPYPAAFAAAPAAAVPAETGPVHADTPHPVVSHARRSIVELLHTADLLRRRFMVVLAPYRVSLPQYNVLRILRGAQGEPLTSPVIADRMIEQTVGVASLLERMELLGWIARERGAEPAGGERWRLVSGGEWTLNQLDPVMDAECERLMKPLGETERHALAALLQALREG